jgi:uncharacterized membrane protein (Fun14 family)
MITPSSSPSPNPTTETKSELGAGAIAGIAIGVALVVITLGILLFLLLRKQNRQYGVVRQYPSTQLQELNGEATKDSMVQDFYIAEASSETKVLPVEIDSRQGRGPPVELDTGRHNW